MQFVGNNFELLQNELHCVYAPFAGPRLGLKENDSKLLQLRCKNIKSARFSSAVQFGVA